MYLLIIYLRILIYLYIYLYLYIERDIDVQVEESWCAYLVLCEPLQKGDAVNILISAQALHIIATSRQQRVQEQWRGLGAGPGAGVVAGPGAWVVAGPVTPGVTSPGHPAPAAGQAATHVSHHQSPGVLRASANLKRESQQTSCPRLRQGPRALRRSPRRVQPARAVKNLHPSVHGLQSRWLQPAFAATPLTRERSTRRHWCCLMALALKMTRIKMVMRQRVWSAGRQLGGSSTTPSSRQEVRTSRCMTSRCMTASQQRKDRGNWTGFEPYTCQPRRCILRRESRCSEPGTHQ